MSKRQMIDYLRERADARMARCDELLREAQHLRLHMPHCEDPYKDGRRIQDCEALAKQEQMFAIGLRLEAQVLEESMKKRTRKAVAAA
jgi:hypothetical protein